MTFHACIYMNLSCTHTQHSVHAPDLITAAVCNLSRLCTPDIFNKAILYLQPAEFHIIIWLQAAYVLFSHQDVVSTPAADLSSRCGRTRQRRVLDI